MLQILVLTDRIDEKTVSNWLSKQTYVFISVWKMQLFCVHLVALCVRFKESVAVFWQLNNWTRFVLFQSVLGFVHRVPIKRSPTGVYKVIGFETLNWVQTMLYIMRLVSRKTFKRHVRHLVCLATRITSSLASCLPGFVVGFEGGGVVELSIVSSAHILGFERAGWLHLVGDVVLSVAGCTIHDSSWLHVSILHCNQIITIFNLLTREKQKKTTTKIINKELQKNKNIFST